MKITAFSSDNSVFIDAEHIHGFAFIEAAIMDLCAFLPHICSGCAFRQVKCALFSRFECLLPRIVSACYTCERTHLRM